MVSVPGLLVMLACVTPSPVEDELPGWAGVYAGAFVLHGEPWPVRLELHGPADAARARLDVPTLGMIDEPMDVRTSDAAAVRVAFPFGLGVLDLAPDGDGLSASGGTAVLEVTRLAETARPWTSEPFAFEAADGLLLHGTLFRPRAAGPHAGVVLAHGASTADRSAWEYRSWAPVYAQLGLAALVYDRRADADLSVLADDLRAAHAALRSHADVRADAVGLAGGSQAAWLGTHVAAREPSIAFLAMSGWPAVTPCEQDRQMLREGMRVDGLPESAIAAATSYHDLQMFVARTGRGLSVLRAEGLRTLDEPWGDYVTRTGTLDELSWWTRNMDFGGEDDLSAVRCPVLAIYGERDWVVPPAHNAEPLRASLLRAGRDDVTVIVLPEADHRGEIPMIQGAGAMRWPRLAPELLGTLGPWLHARGWTSGAR